MRCRLGRDRDQVYQVGCPGRREENCRTRQQIYLDWPSAVHYELLDYSFACIVVNVNFALRPRRTEFSRRRACYLCWQRWAGSRRSRRIPNGSGISLMALFG